MPSRSLDADLVLAGEASVRVSLPSASHRIPKVLKDVVERLR